MVVWQYRLVRSYRALVDGLLSWHCNVVATYAHWQAGMPRGHICMRQTMEAESSKELREEKSAAKTQTQVAE